jgi:DNA-binding transcriptional LysR family regulator
LQGSSLVTLDQLKVFVAVAERLHVTRAAETLGITQSTASASLQALERQYDVRLFNRVGRNIALTRNGETLLREARPLLDHARRVSDVLRELSGTQNGGLSIAASQTIASYWLPARLTAFKNTHPACDLRVVAGTTDFVQKSVQIGSVELGFVGSAVDSANLACERIGQDRLHVVVGPTHPWANGGKVTTRDFASVSWVMREAGSGTRREFETAVAQAAGAPPLLKVVLELPSDEGIISAVSAGIGAGVLTGMVARQAAASGLVAIADFDLPQRPFYALWHAERFQSKWVSTFLDGLSGAEGRLISA